MLFHLGKSETKFAFFLPFIEKESVLASKKSPILKSPKSVNASADFNLHFCCWTTEAKSSKIVCVFS